MPKSAQERHVALMRGLNVGGKNKMPMGDLVRFFEAQGATDVRTYIQSGNVVFSAKPSSVNQLVDGVTKRIADEAGLKVPIVLRSASELSRLVRRNPFPQPATEGLHVLFLRDVPASLAVAALDPNRSPGDTFQVVERDVYVQCVSVAKTKLTNAYFDRKLSTVSTLRHWRTVLTLIEMCEAS